MFDTYGPFVLAEHTSDGLDNLFEQIRDAEIGLQHGIGIYVIAAGDPLLPWYVGRTCVEFGTRLLQHYKSWRFEELLESQGPLSLFLLPRATHGGKIKRSTDQVRTNGLKSIRQFEFALIGTCMKLNPFLLNKQERTFHETLHVPGYIDHGAKDRDFPAAKALAKLLRT